MLLDQQVVSQSGIRSADARRSKRRRQQYESRRNVARSSPGAECSTRASEPRQEGAGRHRRPCAVRRPRRRARSVGRRLRHQGRRSRPSCGRSVARRADGARAVVSRRRRRRPGVARGRCLSRPAVRRPGRVLRLAVAPSRSTRVDSGSDRCERGRRAQAGLFATPRSEQGPAARARPSRDPRSIRVSGTAASSSSRPAKVEERIVTTRPESSTAASRSQAVAGGEAWRARVSSPTSTLARISTASDRGARRRVQINRFEFMQWLTCSGCSISVKRPVFATVLILSLIVVGAFSFCASAWTASRRSTSPRSS